MSLFPQLIIEFDDREVDKIGERKLLELLSDRLFHCDSCCVISVRLLARISLIISYEVENAYDKVHDGAEVEDDVRPDNYVHITPYLQ